MMTTLPGFADMTTQLLTQIGGGIAAKRIIDATGIEGNFDASLDISLAEVMAMAKSSGIETSPDTAAVASDPGSGGATLAEALHSMGLRLETRKASVEQFIVDHIEKTPTEN
jgi:uncharacterized protein (TIGR03435 family)